MTEQDIAVLQELAQDNRGWVSERAQIALGMITDFQAGSMNEDEYMELMQDLVRADRLDEEADDLETKTLLVTAIYGAAQII